MSIREEMEAREAQILSPYAALSRNSLGRDVEEEPCDIRTVYQRDRDRIIHCKAFRRLKHKTQVFLAPAGDHYRTRLTHTVEGSQIARTIARALRLNEDLTEAIALGHDLGHTPFGHAGEAILDEICEEGFSHYQQSVRVVELLEKDGRGLNLTKEVRDGILNHRTSGHPATMEGKVVRFSDKIAYINHDIDDAIRAGILTEEMLPEVYTRVLGRTVRERLNTLIHSVIENSLDQPDIRMDGEVEIAMQGLRRFMFENVYTGTEPKKEDGKAQRLLQELYFYYMDHMEEMPEEYINLVWIRQQSLSRVVCDYVAGMTDNFAVDTFDKLFVPQFW
ncbi:MAG: deoxyguanosinetriphosphate triphosphohydrolase [Lachnospiraceae bacterium]|nr:deoxyguanosinetriphosphate triphosphohydrolase [Lachnospiraceae bacterium]